MKRLIAGLLLSLTPAAFAKRCPFELRFGGAPRIVTASTRNHSQVLATVARNFALRGGRHQNHWKVVSSHAMPGDLPWVDLASGQRVILTPAGREELRANLLSEGIDQVDTFMPVAAEYLGAQLDGLRLDPTQADMSFNWRRMSEDLQNTLEVYQHGHILMLEQNGAKKIVLGRQGLQTAQALYSEAGRDHPYSFNSYVGMVEDYLNSQTKP